MNIKKIILTVAVVSSLPCCFANEDDGIQEFHRNEFFKEGDSYEFMYLPESDLAQKIKEFWTDGTPSFISENYYIVKKDQLNDDPSKVNVDTVSKVLRSPGKMNTMTYKHNRKYIQLYKNSHFIDNPVDKNMLPDWTEGSCDGFNAYCVLDDNSLGKMYFDMHYFQDENEVVTKFNMCTPLTVGLIKAIEKDNMIINIAIEDLGDSLGVYLMIDSKFPSLGFLKSMMEDSFNRRLDSIYRWFIVQFKDF